MERYLLLSMYFNNINLHLHLPHTMGLFGCTCIP